MGLDSTLAAAVEKAFSALGDLTKTGSLVHTSVTGFDFSTGTTTGGDSAPIAVELVMVQNNKTEEGVAFDAVVKKVGFTKLAAGDIITVDSVPYTVDSPVDSSYVIECKLKEGK